MDTEFENISFDMPKSQSNTIKVIGVGGGGSNAVEYMYQQQIVGVDFVICNTDAQALQNNPVPLKIQLGASLTSGLGAGANPEVGENAAKESLGEIQEILNTQTKMVFITAGMGGGTGTGAAPIIAKIAKDLDILTVGIVTMPFTFEGRTRYEQAKQGVIQLRNNVDSLIVINNNKLREIYGNLGRKTAFSKADEVLSTAARGIAEVITHHYKQNIDLHDARTVLHNSGTAIMGSAKESGENRAKNAITKALDSPLLNDNKITGAKNVLLLIISGADEITLDEIGAISDFIQDEAGYEANIIMGIGEDESLDDSISVTVIATGFAVEQQTEIGRTNAKKIIHTLEEEQVSKFNFSNIPQPNPDDPINITEGKNQEDKKIIHQLEEKVENTNPEIASEGIINNKDLPIQTTMFSDVPEKKETQSDEPEKVYFQLTDDEDETTDDSILVRESSLENKNITGVAPKISPTIKNASTIQHQLENQPEEEKKEIVSNQNLTNNIEPFITKKSSFNTNDFNTSKNDDDTPDRKQKIKLFNYQFLSNGNQNVESREKHPAYKRMGVDLNENSEEETTDHLQN